MTQQLEWIRSTVTDDVTYPAAPWPLLGSLWLTLFRVAEAVDERHPAGLYGAAFVSYEAGSPLTYSELLVAHPVEPENGRGRRIRITDIWVDSPQSVAGGRELWAIPKGLADFDLETERRGPFTTTAWGCTLGRTPVAAATFKDVSGIAPRTPFKAGLSQPGIEDTGFENRTATMQGSSKVFPARARWDVNPDGPVGFLAGAQQLASFRQASFRMSVG